MMVNQCAKSAQHDHSTISCLSYHHVRQTRYCKTMIDHVTIPTSIDQSATMPQYKHYDDAGADLCTTIDFSIKPFERLLIPTGVYFQIPDGYVGLVHPRSGLAVNKGITVLNAPGTIDSGYRGEIKVPLINLDPTHTWDFHHGDRIAQIVFQQYVTGIFSESTIDTNSSRGKSGFGSTGIN